MTGTEFMKKETRKINPNNENERYCSDCKTLFPDFQTRLHHQCKPHKCTECLKEFKFDYQLQFHKCTENKEEPESSNESLVNNKEKLHYNCNEIVPSNSNDNAHFETESFLDDLSDSEDKLSNMNSIVLPIGNKRRRKSNLFESSSETSLNKVNDSVVQEMSKKKNKIHLSGKFKTPKRNHTKHNGETSEANNVPAKRSRKLSKVKTKIQNCKVPRKEIPVVPIETNILPSISTPETATCINNVDGEGMSSAKKNSKDKTDVSSVQVVLSDIKKLPVKNKLNENKVENCDKTSESEIIKDKNTIMKKIAKQLKVTLESTSSVKFNGIHSNHSTGKNTNLKLKKNVRALIKNAKKRNIDSKMHNKSDSSVDIKNPEIEEGNLSNDSSCEKSVPNKGKKSRSTSRDIKNPGIEEGNLSNNSSCEKSVPNKGRKSRSTSRDIKNPGIEEGNLSNDSSCEKSVPNEARKSRSTSTDIKNPGIEEGNFSNDSSCEKSVPNKGRKSRSTSTDIKNPGIEEGDLSNNSSCEKSVPNKGRKSRSTSTDIKNPGIEEGNLSNNSSCEKSVPNKGRKSRSTSREHSDDNTNAFTTSSSSSSSSLSSSPVSTITNKNQQEIQKKVVLDDRIEINNSVRSKRKRIKHSNQTSVLTPLNKSSISVSDFQLQKNRNCELRRKTVINGNNTIFNRRTRHIPLELEISESTLINSADNIASAEVGQNHKYAGFKKMHYLKGKKPMSNEMKIKNNVELGDILNTLPAECNILLKTPPSSFHNFRCPKCNKLFKHLKTGSNHSVSCKSSRFRSNALISINEIIYICTTCQYNCTSESELTNHKTMCTKKNIPDNLLKFDGTSRELTCSTCSFSCLTRRTFDSHSCHERLEYMQACIVNVQKINPLKCKYLDDKDILNTVKLNMPDGSSEEFSEIKRTYISSGIKQIVNNAGKCVEPDDVEKKIIEPVLNWNSIFNPDNVFPDLNLDMTLPFEKQNAIAEVALKYIREDLERQGGSVENTCLNNDDSSNDSNLDTQSKHFLNQLKNYKCKCERNIDPNVEAKPCIKCLNTFIQNSPWINHSPDLQMDSSMPGPSGLNVNNSNVQENCTSLSASNNTTPISENHITSEISSNICTNSLSNNIASGHLVSEVGSLSDHICSAPINLSVTADTETPLETNSSVQFSQNVGDIHPSMELLSDINIKQLGLLSNNFKSTSCSLDLGTPGIDSCASSDLLSANCDIDFNGRNCVDISGDLSCYRNKETMNALDHLSEENTNLDLFLKQSNCIDDFANSLESLKQSDLEFILNPQYSNIQRGNLQIIISDCEATVSMADCKMTVFADRENDELHSEKFSNVVGNLLTNLQKFISDSESNSDIFEEIIHVICEEDLNVDTNYKSLHLSIHHSFQSSVVYSAYIIRESSQYFCAACTEEISPSVLIRHMTEKHKEHSIYISVA